MPAGGSESRMPMATSLWTRSRPALTHTVVQPCRPPECVLYRAANVRCRQKAQDRSLSLKKVTVRPGTP